MNINMHVSNNNVPVHFQTNGNEKHIGGKVSDQIVIYSGDVDYVNNVVNKPTLNGKTIVGNMEEEDPTIQPITLEEINNLFDSV